jgi:hypothetical protein
MTTFLSSSLTCSATQSGFFGDGGAQRQELSQASLRGRLVNRRDGRNGRDFGPLQR